MGCAGPVRAGAVCPATCVARQLLQHHGRYVPPFVPPLTATPAFFARLALPPLTLKAIFSRDLGAGDVAEWLKAAVC